MKSLAKALEQAAGGLSSISGGKLDERPAGEIGAIQASKIDLGMPDETTSTLVGNIEPVAVIPSAEPDPQTYEGKWPHPDPAITKAIHGLLVPSRKPDERGA